jgi:hypothetical protein
LSEGERAGEVARLGWCQLVSVRHGKRPIGGSWLLGQSFSVARRHTDALHHSAEARVMRADGDLLRLRRRDDRAGGKSAFSRAHHRDERASDEAQDAQRLVHAVPPHHGYGNTLPACVTSSSIRRRRRLRLHPAHPDPVTQRSRGGSFDDGAHRLGQGDHRGGPDTLESNDPDAIVDMGRKLEMRMPSDRPRMLMRKRSTRCSKRTGSARFRVDRRPPHRGKFSVAPIGLPAADAT